jgi:hypothetical protein
MTVESQISALFWDITQRRVVIVYRPLGPHIGPIFKGQNIFKGQEVQQERLGLLDP